MTEGDGNQSQTDFTCFKFVVNAVFSIQMRVRRINASDVAGQCRVTEAHYNFLHKDIFHLNATKQSDFTLDSYAES